MGLCWERMEFRTEEYAQITGFDGSVRDLVIPEKIEGLAVRSIAAHAFENHTELRSAVLPRSLVTLRPFAFYNCTNLKTLELFNTANDYYDGVIRRCPSLECITVHCDKPDDYVIVRSMLQDVDGTLTFHLLLPDGELRLTFPEYVNEAKEDTMARAIHFSIEGAGMAYRECAGKKSIDLPGYDRLLQRLTAYDLAVGADIAFGRLRYPLGLSQEAQEGYEKFLSEHDDEVLRVLIQAEDEAEAEKNLRLMTGRRLIGEAALETALQLAAEKKKAGLCARLIAYRSEESSSKETGGGQVLSLDW